ncbi:MAG: amidohydrolase [Syntrophobacterales bacterium]|nr:amidohydrolase [Syntrophobacterales bacterium]
MTIVDTIILGGRVLPMDDMNTVLTEGAVAIEGENIVAVASVAEIKSRFTGHLEIDARDSLIMPGLINSHTHAAMTCFRGIADDMELMEWLNRYIFPAEARNVDPELAYRGSMLACAEMIRSGTTTFCDMYIFEDETARAAKEAGVRCLVGEVLFDFPSPNFQTPAEGLSYTRKLLEKWAGDSLVQIVVEPHALYTCSPSLLKDAKALADEFRAPYATHLLENKMEANQLQEKFGKPAMKFLEEIGFLSERFTAFHCVAMTDEDIRIFADHGCRAVHNPESNMKLASGIAPVSAMRKQGIPVGLGTDGCASNNDLNMFGEMDTAAKLAKVASLDPTALPALDVIRMATCEGARALGLEHETGSLEVGKKADIIIIGLKEPHLTPLYNEYSQIVYAAAGADVDTVFINGKMVMQNRKLLTIDEKEAMERVREIAVRVRKSL